MSFSSDCVRRRNSASKVNFCVLPPPIGQYIVDFVSLERQLIIEIDGGQHNQQPEIEKDEVRTKRLEKKGFKVIRFWNTDVLLNIEGVAIRILDAINSNK